MGVRNEDEENQPEATKAKQNHPEIGEAVKSKLVANVVCKQDQGHADTAEGSTNTAL